HGSNLREDARPNWPLEFNAGAVGVGKTGERQLIDERHLHEVEHGKYLASGMAEEIWGWGTPAGQLRAKRRAELIMQGAEVGPSTVAMEIGCGTGLFTEMFARTASHIVAVDISPDLLKIARGKGIPGVVFLEKSFEDWEGNEVFDAVIGSSIL